MAKRLTTLTAPGASEELTVKSYKYHRFRVKVTNINTSVTVRVETSLDKVEWDTTSDSEEVEDQVLTEDEVYNFIITDLFPIEHARLNFVSEVGGTDAELEIDYIGGNL